MNVLFVQPALPHYRVPFFERLQRDAHWRVTVWSDHASPLHTPGDRFGFSAEHRPERHLGPFVWQPALVEAVRTAWSDVVVLSWNTRYFHLLPALLEARLCSKPVVLWGHGYSKNERPLRRRVRNQWGRLAAACVTYSESARRRLQNEGFAPERIFCAPNALHDEPLRDTYGRAEAGLEASVGGSEKRGRHTILFVSRLEPDKQPVLLIEAFALVHARVPDARLVIVGTGSEKYAVLERIRALGLEHCVELMGALYDERELARLFLASHVFAYPRAIGLSLLHAFSYGLPVVTARSPERHNPEFDSLVPEVNGLTYADGNVRDFARQIERVLCDSTLRATLSRGAIDAVRPPHGKTLSNMVQGMCCALEYAAARRS